jgi:hypothetical protein
MNETDPANATYYSTEFCDATEQDDGLLLRSSTSYTANQFANTRNIERTRYGVPRFGHPKNINLLLLGFDTPSDSDGKAYIDGIVASCIAITIFCLFWIGVLVPLRCLGPKRVGMWDQYRTACCYFFFLWLAFLQCCGCRYLRLSGTLSLWDVLDQALY